ncbi:methyl-accepting chemotaxis protein [Azomonas macrocytogenes]|nr:methyl-accepting chemotaxis protein [Azomonas macrocytogenes]
MHKNLNASALLAGMRNNRLVTFLFFVLIVSTVLLSANFAYVGTLAGYDNEYMRNAGELRMISQRIATNAVEASAGTPEAFQKLREARGDFQQRWDVILHGDENLGLPAVPTTLAPSIEAVQQDWNVLRKNTDAIIGQEQTVLALHQLADNLTRIVPQLQAEYEDIVDILLARNAPAAQIAVAQRQSLLAERILGSSNRLLAGGQDAQQAAEAFNRDISQFGQVLDGMLQGSQPQGIVMVTERDARARLDRVAKLFQSVSGPAEKILGSSAELQQVRESAHALFGVSNALLDKVSLLLQGLEMRVEGRRIYSFIGYGLAALVLVSIMLIGLVIVRQARRRLNETAEKNDRNQAAILRLLDEIADLADGDLTVTATVTEDFTGAIADSINYSIDQLRELVQTINQTAVQVASAAEQTQATATHLAEASKHQAQEIAGASAAINEIAVSIDQVSANALESAAVAERSVAIANKGNEVVHNTIAGMDNIREQIQDTSKRIKRLGESSQEIGDIVGLIDDIADQTNILALNAAIQASMAGDAGRGFAVVADEVQRLAERSSAATKQIEALVKTIQSDTNEAVISMEQTTAEVVRGAHLAQDAGVALEDIEKVSRTLAALIQNISNAARQQTSSASHISSTMNVIREITSQTSAGTTATARSIGNLTQLASEMRRSVSDFTLPQTRRPL